MDSAWRAFETKLLLNCAPLAALNFRWDHNDLFKKARGNFQLIKSKVERGSASWGSLNKAAAKKMSDAIQMLKDASAQGHAGAQFFLGVMYDHSHGVKQDYAQAFKWFSKAAKQGDANAQYNLGAMYHQGHGVKQDDALSVQWLKMAARQGHNEAILALKRVHSQAVPECLDRVCAHCSTQASKSNPLMTCSRCKSAFYCSRNCQRAHCKAGHKKICVACSGAS